MMRGEVLIDSSYMHQRSKKRKQGHIKLLVKLSKI